MMVFIIWEICHLLPFFCSPVLEPDFHLRFQIWGCSRSGKKGLCKARQVPLGLAFSAPRFLLNLGRYYQPDRVFSCFILLSISIWSLEWLVLESFVILIDSCKHRSAKYNISKNLANTETNFYLIWIPIRILFFCSPVFLRIHYILQFRQVKAKTHLTFWLF